MSFENSIKILIREAIREELEDLQISPGPEAKEVMSFREGMEYLGVTGGWFKHHRQEVPYHQDGPHANIWFLRSELIDYVKGLPGGIVRSKIRMRAVK